MLLSGGSRPQVSDYQNFGNLRLLLLRKYQVGLALADPLGPLVQKSVH
jgi:hypothetical protein